MKNHEKNSFNFRRTFTLRISMAEKCAIVVDAITTPNKLKLFWTKNRKNKDSEFSRISSK